MPAHRKPVAVKLLHGSRIRNGQQRAEIVFGGPPRCPGWLHRLAKQEWKRIMVEFADTGLIQSTDRAALAAYCQSYARMITAEQIVSEQGQMFKEPVFTRSGNPTGKYRRKKHPAVTIAKDERTAMISAARLFGFDPISRQHITVSAPDDPLAPSVDDDNDDDLFVN